MTYTTPHEGIAYNVYTHIGLSRPAKLQVSHQPRSAPLRAGERVGGSSEGRELAPLSESNFSGSNGGSGVAGLTLQVISNAGSGRNYRGRHSGRKVILTPVSCDTPNGLSPPNTSRSVALSAPDASTLQTPADTVIGKPLVHLLSSGGSSQCSNAGKRDQTPVTPHLHPLACNLPSSGSLIPTSQLLAPTRSGGSSSPPSGKRLHAQLSMQIELMLGGDKHHVVTYAGTAGLSFKTNKDEHWAPTNSLRL